MIGLLDAFKGLLVLPWNPGLVGSLGAFYEALRLLGRPHGLLTGCGIDSSFRFIVHLFLGQRVSQGGPGLSSQPLPPYPTKIVENILIPSPPPNGLLCAIQ